jgi:ubiquinone/menaquinone biosynthesis C-methylase UbiE
MNVSPDARVLDIGCGSGWATRLLAEYAAAGRVTGIDISDEMIQLAREQSQSHPNVDFEVASAERLPFADDEYTHAFSMESLYYYRDLPKALGEIHRVMKAGGLFCAVVDLYWESPATHQWVEDLKVPVQLLRIDEYRSLFAGAGFVNFRDQRVIDPRPVPDDYTSGSFKSRADFVAYREAGSLMITGEVAK